MGFPTRYFLDNISDCGKSYGRSAIFFLGALLEKPVVMNPARVFGTFLWAQLRRAPLVCKAHTQECSTGVPRSMATIFLPNEPD